MDLLIALRVSVPIYLRILNNAINNYINSNILLQNKDAEYNRLQNKDAEYNGEPRILK